MLTSKQHHYWDVETMTISQRFLASSLFLLAGVAMCSGCGPSGPEIAEVTGTLTLKGKPVSGLVINFVPDSGGKTSGAASGGDGSFRLVYNPRTAGALVGGHTVSVALDGRVAKSLTGSRHPVEATKKVQVNPSDNNFVLSLEEFDVGRR